MNSDIFESLPLSDEIDRDKIVLKFVYRMKQRLVVCSDFALDSDDPRCSCGAPLGGARRDKQARQKSANALFEKPPSPKRIVNEPPHGLWPRW